MNDFDNFIGSLSDEQKQKLLQALTKTDSNTTSTKSANVDDNFIVHKADKQQHRRKEAVKARRNEWEDTGEFKDISTPDVERTPRRRPPPQKSDVECHVCGKSFKIDPRFAYGEYYRCNKCSGKK